MVNKFQHSYLLTKQSHEITLSRRKEEAEMQMDRLQNDLSYLRDELRKEKESSFDLEQKYQTLLKKERELLESTRETLTTKLQKEKMKSSSQESELSLLKAETRKLKERAERAEQSEQEFRNTFQAESSLKFLEASSSIQVINTLPLEQQQHFRALQSYYVTKLAKKDTLLRELQRQVELHQSALEALKNERLLSLKTGGSLIYTADAFQDAECSTKKTTTLLSSEAKAAKLIEENLQKDIPIDKKMQYERDFLHLVEEEKARRRVQENNQVNPKGRTSVAPSANQKKRPPQRKK
jgi:hypothetical protein